MAYPLNVGKAVFDWTGPNGARCLNVLSFARSDDMNLTNTDCANIGAELLDWYSNANYQSETNASFRSILSTFILLNTITVSDVGPGPTVQHTTAIGLAGTAATAPLPNESAVVSTWYTATPGRRGRGRTYWPGANASDMSTSDGTLSSAAVALYQDTLDALWRGIQDTAYEMRVHSPTAGDSYEVTSCVVRDTVHHQRRRNS